MTPRRSALALALAAALAAGCSDEPSGPGAYRATVEGPVPPGALVLAVDGPGVTGFEGSGDVRVFGDPTPPLQGPVRVVVVSASGDRPSFRIKVEDLSAAPPAVTVVSVVDTLDVPVPTPASYTVRVSR